MDAVTTEAVLRFTISDTGIGIPHDKQWQIFGAFVQADASTTRRFGGTGLGLTISAHLVEMMGGRIWLTSEPGRGSRFRFVARFGLQHRESEQPPAPILGRLRALVVDDNPTSRAILRELLGSWRMHADVADGARTALTMMKEAAAGRSAYDLVLADAVMPGPDGFALARDIAGDAALSTAKVIVLTSPDAPSRETRGLQRTIVAQLTKPVKQSDLMDAILNAFGGDVTVSGATSTPSQTELPHASPPPARPPRGRQSHEPEAGRALSRRAWRSSDGGEHWPRRGGTSGGGACTT